MFRCERRLLSGITQASQQKKNHHDAGHRSLHRTLVREAAPSHSGNGGSAGRVQNAYAVDKEARDRGGGVLEEIRQQGSNANMYGVMLVSWRRKSLIALSSSLDGCCCQLITKTLWGDN